MLKPVSINEFDLLYDSFISYDQEELSRILGFVPNKKELKYHFFDDPDGEPELLLGAYCNNQLQGFIHAIRRPWKATSVNIGYIKWLQVFKVSPNRAVVGRALLTAIEQCLVALGCEQLQFGSAAPYYLIPGVAAEDQFTRSLLNQCNWNESSDRISLQVKPVECDRNGELFTQLQADHDSVKLFNFTVPDAKLEEFITKYFSCSWAAEVKFGLTNIHQAHCSVLKDANGEIIGFAAVHAVNRNWFGPMGILPELRNRGLGKLILLHAMRQATTNRIDSLILSWVNDKADFYQKIFPSAKEIIFKKTIKYLVPDRRY